MAENDARDSPILKGKRLTGLVWQHELVRKSQQADRNDGGLIDVTFWSYLPIAILFAVFTPVLALIVTILATNKIQAFALFKTLGSIFMIPIFALAVEGWLQYIFSPIPNFWTFIALEHLLESGTNDYVFIAIGFIYHSVILSVLFHLFNKKF